MRYEKLVRPKTEVGKAPNMNKCFLALVFLGFLTTATTASACPPLAPGNTGVSVADYMIATWPTVDGKPTLDNTDCGSKCFSLAYGTVPATPNPKFWEYTNGVPLYGIWKLFERTGFPKYYRYVKAFVDQYVDADGNISYATRPGFPANDPTVQDTMQPATLLFGLYRVTHDKKYLTAMAKARDVFNVMKKARVIGDTGVFWHKPNYPNQQWLDAIYMSEPFLTKFGALYADEFIRGDSKDCFDTATLQIVQAAEHTVAPDKNLYYHAWNGALDLVWQGLTYTSGRSAPLPGTAVSPILWSRSLAWYFAGIVDTLEYLPRHHADRSAIIEIVRNIAKGLERYQDPATGLWYQVIDQMDDPPPANGGYPNEAIPGQPNWLETSSSSIFVYSLAKSVRLGYLPFHYIEVARKGWKGVKSRVEIDGDQVTVYGTVVGMSVGGTYNAYVNADFRTDLDTGAPPADPSCAARLAQYQSPPLECKYLFVRPNVPQGMAGVMLASTEMEF
jgi:unsaturated rhamnogalacturonyl hydrolase